MNNNYGNAPEIIREMSYYDAALAAQLITVPTMIGVGFIDNTCHPTKVYAAYNNLGGPKAIDNFYNFGHGSAPGWRDRGIEWLQRVFGMERGIGQWTAGASQPPYREMAGFALSKKLMHTESRGSRIRW